MSRSVINPPERSVPFSNGKYTKFGLRNAGTAARRAAKRRARGKRGAWLREWPHQKTQKQGKNAGRAPTYTDRRLAGDPGPRPGTGGWPHPEGTKTKVVR